MTVRHLVPRAALAALALSALATGGCGPTTGNTTSSNNGSGSVQGQDITYTIDQPVRSITLDALSGGVDVAAKNGPISVTERPRFTDSKPTTSHNVTGDTLNLREEGCPSRAVNSRCEVGWDISAPAGTVLNLQTRAGGIELRGMAADVTARTNAGGVEARELTSRRITASSNAGGIELDFAQPPDQVSAEGTAGGIEITVPAGTSYAVEADTKAGKPDIEVPTDNASPHKIKAQTRAGGVEIKNR